MDGSHDFWRDVRPALVAELEERIRRGQKMALNRFGGDTGRAWGQFTPNAIRGLEAELSDWLRHGPWRRRDDRPRDFDRWGIRCEADPHDMHRINLTIHDERGDLHGLNDLADD